MHHSADFSLAIVGLEHQAVTPALTPIQAQAIVRIWTLYADLPQTGTRSHMAFLQQMGAKLFLCSLLHGYSEAGSLPCAGLFTLWLMGGFAGSVPAEVWAIEPAPPTLAILRRNINACGLRDKVCTTSSRNYCPHMDT